MFNRKYASRDRRKSRRNARSLYYRAWGSIEVLVAFKLKRSEPIEDNGRDWIYLTEDGYLTALSHRNMATLTADQLEHYTTPVPFCIVPEGGTDPKKTQGGRMPRNYFRKPTEIKAEVALLRSMSKEATAKLSDELPPLPTFEEQLARAGGKVLSVPNVHESADWHEQDGSI